MNPKEREMHLKINYRNILKRWASKADSDLRKSANARKYKLSKSIGHSSRILQDIKEFTFKYYLYGMFVDMNVGRGRPLGANKEDDIINKLLGVKKRKRKSKKEYMWYSKPMWFHTKMLEGIVMREYRDRGATAIHFPEVIELTFNNNGN